MPTSRLLRADEVIVRSPLGTSRHFAATQQFSRFRSKAAIQRAHLQKRIYEYASISRDSSNRGIARVLSSGCAIGESAEARQPQFLCAPPPCEAVDAVLQGAPHRPNA